MHTHTHRESPATTGNILIYMNLNIEITSDKNADQTLRYRVPYTMHKCEFFFWFISQTNITNSAHSKTHPKTKRNEIQNMFVKKENVRIKLNKMEENGNTKSTKPRNCATIWMGEMPKNEWNEWMDEWKTERMKRVRELKWKKTWGEILCKTETRPKMNVSTYLNLTCRCTEAPFI